MAEAAGPAADNTNLRATEAEIAGFLLIAESSGLDGRALLAKVLRRASDRGVPAVDVIRASYADAGLWRGEG